jgi:hypothetical protein
MKVMRKMRKLDDLYDSDFEGGTDSTPVHSATPKSSKLVPDHRGLLTKRKRKPIDSDSDSDIDAPERINGDFFPHRLVQPESSISLTSDVSQSKVVSAGADVIKFSLASSLSDSPNVLGPTSVAVPLLDSSHSTSALKAAIPSESSSSLQNINESPLINQDNYSDKSVVDDPIVKQVRGKSKMCLGDLLDKRSYQKSPIISKLSSSNSPGVKTPIISSSSSSNLDRNNVDESGAQGLNCVRLEADDDDWMEDFIPVKNSETPTPKKRKNAKDNQITKTIENKSRKKVDDSVDRSVDMKEKKKKTVKEKDDKKGKKREKNDEDVRNEKIERDNIKKEGKADSAVKERLIAAAVLSARGDVNEMTSRPLLLPLMPLDTAPSLPTLPVLPIPTTTTASVPTSIATVTAAVTAADADAADGTLPTTSTTLCATSAQSLGGIPTLTSTSTSNPSKRNLPKSLVVKRILSGGRKLNMCNELLCELDATSLIGNPVVDKVVDLFMLRNPLKASRTIENVSDVTGVCNPADKIFDTEGESEQRLKECYFRLWNSVYNVLSDIKSRLFSCIGCNYHSIF